MRQLEHDEPVLIWNGRAMLDGHLKAPRGASMAALVASLGGTTYHSGYRRIATRFNEIGAAVLLADLLTDDELQIDSRTGRFQFDVFLLAERVREIVDWLRRQPYMLDLPLVFFGTATPAAAALLAETDKPHTFDSLVLASGNLDLIAASTKSVRVPTLLLVPESDAHLMRINREAFESMSCKKKMIAIHNAGPFIDDDVTIGEIERQAAAWVLEHVPVFS
jgi:putative phosphoribosyl transferase